MGEGIVVRVPFVDKDGKPTTVAVPPGATVRADMRFTLHDDGSVTGVARGTIVPAPETTLEEDHAEVP